MASDTECRYCGESFGNAGAKTNHERACPHNPENAPPKAQQGQPARTQSAATPPARREGEAAAPPAQRDRGGTGGTLVDAAIAVTDDDLPAEVRREAVKDGLGIVGDMFFRYQEYRNRKLQEQNQRAANVQLEEVTEYPVCNECEYQFDGTDIGLSDEEVRCPDCGKLYRAVDVPEEVDAEGR